MTETSQTTQPAREETPSLLNSVINWKMSLVQSFFAPSVSARFESQVRSLESKLTFTELFPISYSGHSALFLHYSKAVASHAPVLQTERIGSIAQLAHIQLQEMLDSSRNEAQKRRVCRALGYDEARTEECLKQKTERASSLAISPAVSSEMESPLSTSFIQRRVANSETLDRVRQQERVFAGVYPGEASYLSYSVSLALDAQQKHYQVCLRYNTLVANVVRSYDHNVRLPEPYSQEHLEEKLYNMCGPINERFLKEAA